MKILSELEHFPKLYGYNESTLSIYMEYCGERVNNNNSPIDWKKQLTVIMGLMNSKNIFHNDMFANNFLCKDNVIYILLILDGHLYTKIHIHI